MATYNGYCLKEKKKGMPFEGEEVVKGNRRYAMGKCSSCGTNMCLILGKA